LEPARRTSGGLRVSGGRRLRRPPHPARARTAATETGDIADPRSGASIIGPTWLADGLAGVVLICMHVAVGLVLIAGFTRLLPRPADQLSNVWR
jgi:hypothetical protein